MGINVCPCRTELILSFLGWCECMWNSYPISSEATKTYTHPNCLGLKLIHGPEVIWQSNIVLIIAGLTSLLNTSWFQWESVVLYLEIQKWFPNDYLSGRTWQLAGSKYSNSLFKAVIFSPLTKSFSNEQFTSWFSALPASLFSGHFSVCVGREIYL